MFRGRCDLGMRLAAISILRMWRSEGRTIAYWKQKVGLTSEFPSVVSKTCLLFYVGYKAKKTLTLKSVLKISTSLVMILLCELHVSVKCSDMASTIATC